MFEQSLVETSHAVGTRKPAAILASMGLQAAVLLVVGLVPLVRYQLLPALELATQLDAPAPLPTVPAAPAPLRVTRLSGATPSVSVPPVLPPAPALPVAPRTAMPTLVPDGGVGGAPGIGVIAPPPEILPPPAVVDSPPAPPARLAVGGAVQAARCLACPSPVYPQFARQMRLEGTVELHALIAADGAIQQLDRLSGNAILAAAAMRAVRGWRYQPLLLNGRAVAVETVITVRFALAPVE